MNLWYVIISTAYILLLVIYNPDTSGTFVATDLNIDTILSQYASEIAMWTLQLFGLFSYVLLFSFLVRGIRYPFKHLKQSIFKRLSIVVFISLGLVLFNIGSSYSGIQSKISNLNYYAGGVIGYNLSKFIFIDLFHKDNLHLGIFITLFITWIWLWQYVLLIDITKVFKKISKILKSLNSNLNSKSLNLKRFFSKRLNSKGLNSKSLNAKGQNFKNQEFKNQDFKSQNFKNRNIKTPKVIHQDTKYQDTMYQDTMYQDILCQDTKYQDKYVEDFTNEQKAQLQQKTKYTSKCSAKQKNHLQTDYPNDDFIQNKFQRNEFQRNEFQLPNETLLNEYEQINYVLDQSKIQELSNKLIKVLGEFSVRGEIISVKQGPVITMFEFRPAAGIKTSRVISLSDDIARAMSALSARISTIPGQNAIGIELPNTNRQIVYLSELLMSNEFQSRNYGIPLVLGKDISGNIMLADLTKMPHLLVAGTTGSGKSVAINDMILSILYKFKPDQCKLIMIDPKMLELSVYNDIPHLLTPVVTDPKNAIFVLQWAVAEMEKRYKNMAKMGVRNIDGFNKKLDEAQQNPKIMVRRIQTGFDPKTGKPIIDTQKLSFDKMPYIVIVVDEMADLMLSSGKDVESSIQRLAQMARAAGIHLIMATQRPSVDVITGTIKANFPTRISFQVTSKIDSRTILGKQGAEQLLGQGDMLYMFGADRITRIHAPFVSDNEIDCVANFLRSQGTPQYEEIIYNEISNSITSNNVTSSNATRDKKLVQNNEEELDGLYPDALNLIKSEHKCSISLLQRKLQITYSRASKIISQLESNNIISNNNGKYDIL